MSKLVECVPNFSEGRRPEVIEAITAEVKNIPGVKLLDVKADASHNRVVVTFVGEPQAAKQAAFNACKKAAELIDMEKQRGEHPRIGATDVIPFIPVKNMTMEECVQLADELAQEIAEKLEIPVYLYEEAAKITTRKALPDILGARHNLPGHMQPGRVHRLGCHGPVGGLHWLSWLGRLRSGIRRRAQIQAWRA